MGNDDGAGGGEMINWISKGNLFILYNTIKSKIHLFFPKNHLFFPIQGINPKINSAPRKHKHIFWRKKGFQRGGIIV